MDKINEVNHKDWTKNTLEDKSVQLIIADPPYFEVKGSFDFVWDSFEDYLKDVEKWAIECKRLLADNGTLIWWGAAKKIAYSQIIFDKYFNLVNSCVWDKGSFMGLENSEGLRSFAPCTERFLCYASNEMDLTGLQFIEKEYIAPRNPFAIELKRARLEKGVTVNQVAEYGKFYGNVNHGGSVTNWEKGYNVPLLNQWLLLCQYLPTLRTEYEELRTEYEELRTEYEELRTEYEELRRPFKNKYNLKEVLRINNEAIKNQKYKHDTVKPENLTRMLIETCSRHDDLVLVPFAGSGTECAMAARTKRNFIGYDIEKKYVDMANKRCKYIFQTPTLF